MHFTIMSPEETGVMVEAMLFEDAESALIYNMWLMEIALEPGYEYFFERETK